MDIEGVRVDVTGACDHELTVDLGTEFYRMYNHELVSPRDLGDWKGPKVGDRTAATEDSPVK